MKRKLAISATVLLTMCFLGAAIVTAIPAQQADEGGSGPALTIYNQNFAVVRQPLALDLKPGINNIRFTETTSFLEPDSVMLRDPLGRRQLQVLEQNFRNDPVSQELLLSMYEGKTIDFRVNHDKIVAGKIIRSEAEIAGEEAVEPGALLGRERRGFGQQRRDRRRQTLAHAAASNRLLSASTS